MKQCSSYWSGYVEECKSPLFLVQHGPYFHSLLNVCRPAKLVVVAAAIPKFPLFSTYSSFSFLSLVSLFPFATSFSSFWHCSSTTNTIGALPRTSKSERTTSYNTQEGYPTTKRAKRYQHYLVPDSCNASCWLPRHFTASLSQPKMSFSFSKAVDVDFFPGFADVFKKRSERWYNLDLCLCLMNESQVMLLDDQGVMCDRTLLRECTTNAGMSS